MPWPRLARAAVVATASLTMLAIGAGLVVRAHRGGRGSASGTSADSGLPGLPGLHGRDYVGSATCAGCHDDHAASWRRTFHRTMTVDVGPGAPAGVVAGDFSGATYLYGGVEARMDRDAAGRYRMTFTAADGGEKPVEIEVVRAVGSHRYQQYLAQVNGALWRLPMAFHVEEKRWFHMNGAFLTPDPDGDDLRADSAAGTPVARDGWALSPPVGDRVPRFGGGAFDRHVTRWNDNCVFCHNVAPNPGRDPETGAFRTSVAELGVACEACHGPGSAHLARHRDTWRGLGRWAGKPWEAATATATATATVDSTGDSTIVNPARLSPSRSADLCGRCHGQRMSDDIGPVLRHGDPFVPGEDLGLYSAPLWRDTPLRGQPGVFAARFWGDGTPRLTAYEYQGLLQSRCAQVGPLTCTSCHGMHEGNPRGQLRLSARGDPACTSCHADLADRAAAARHTHHEPTGAGARCVACHMPRIVYGVLGVHRSHRIEIPDPAAATVNERPDACTLCHVEASRAWAVEATRRLWAKPRHLLGPRQPEPGTPQPAPDSGLSTTDTLFVGDPVARAVAADAMGRGVRPSGGEPLPDGIFISRASALLAVMAGDRYPAVRHLAARSLGALIQGRNPSAMALLLAFDPTGPPSERARVLAGLRRNLPGIGQPHAAGAVRIAALRARAARSDIDIGE